MKTTIWTAQGYLFLKSSGDRVAGYEAERPRCIFNGEAPQLRKGDSVVIRDGMVERMASAIYDLEDGIQEVGLETTDRERIYATVPLPL